MITITSYHVVSSRLFEDKVYLAVLAKGINIKKNKWAQEDGRDPQETEDLETKIADKVKINQFKLIFHISVMKMILVNIFIDESILISGK